ncbi:MAG TPA: hypothetical protein VKH64_08985 [Candidatus Binatia bacterium]|nr:hypothetical protein [Candidatus Binatia bacterium]
MAVDLEIRLVWSDNGKLYICATVRGKLEISDFQGILRQLAGAFPALSEPVVLDLREATWNADASGTGTILKGLLESRMGIDNKIALVCDRDIDRYGQLMVVVSAASNQGMKTRAFYDFNAALDWLLRDWTH